MHLNLTTYDKEQYAQEVDGHWRTVNLYGPKPRVRIGRIAVSCENRYYSKRWIHLPTWMRVP